MKTLIIILLLGLIAFLIFVLWRKVYRRIGKKETDRLSKLSPEGLILDKQKSLAGLRNTLTVIIPGAALMVLPKEFGWTIAVWISITAFIIGKLFFEYLKKRGDY